MPVVVLVGTLDTKGDESRYVRDRVRGAGCDTLVVDIGIRSSGSWADISADEVAAGCAAPRRDGQGVDLDRPMTPTTPQ